MDIRTSDGTRATAVPAAPGLVVATGLVICAAGVVADGFLVMVDK